MTSDAGPASPARGFRRGNRGKAAAAVVAVVASVVVAWAAVAGNPAILPSFGGRSASGERPELERTQAELRSVREDMAFLRRTVDQLLRAVDSSAFSVEEAREQERERFQKEYLDLLLQYGESQRRFEDFAAAAKRCPVCAARQAPAPPIDAVVSAVDGAERLAVISAGKDQGIEPGFRFTVTRSGRFIGEVEVIKVYPALSGARIVITQGGEEIRQGDRAFSD